MMFTAGLPLVCVTLAAIYLQPVAAQGKPVHHVFSAEMRIYKGTTSKSTVLYFTGYDNNGVEWISTVYADETEGFQFKELHDNEGKLTGCEYTGKVHDGFYTKNPKLAHLRDNNCAIRNAPNFGSAFSGVGTLEVVFGEGKIQYEVKLIYLFNIADLAWSVPQANQGFTFQVSNADLTVYRGGHNTSTVLLFIGQDQNGVNRISTAIVEKKEGDYIYQLTSPQGHVGLCWYPAKVHDGAYSVNPKQGEIILSCAIRDAPKAEATYQAQNIFQVTDYENKIRYKVNSVKFSSIDKLEP